MPGLCGLYNIGKKVLNNKYLLVNMINSMTCYPTYQSKLNSLEKCFMGRVDINEKFSRDIYIDEKKDLMVSFYGDLFEVETLLKIKNDKKNKKPEEIICLLYKKYGTEFIPELNGDFNCTIFDKYNQKFYLFNDRFGYRNIYYYYDSNNFIYGSELKAIVQYPNFDYKIEWQSISDYLRYGYVFGDRTLFKKVELLTPATCLIISQKGIDSFKYYQPKYTSIISLDKISEAAEYGMELFEQSIKRCISEQKNVLVFLSGGLDSRLITSVTSKCNVNLTTATQGAAYSLEYRIAKAVCKALGINKPKRIPVEYSWIHQYLKNIAYISEAKYGSFGSFWQQGVAHKIGFDFDCMLNGIFGGHLTFGSPYFTRNDLENRLSQEKRIERVDAGFNGHIYQRLKKYLSQRCKKRIENFGLFTLKQEFKRASMQSDIPALIQDAIFLYNRIRRAMIGGDQNYYFFIDKYPFASYELYDFYLQLHPELMLEHRLYKEIYKRHLPKLAKIPWWSTGADLYNNKTIIEKLKLKKYAEKADWYTTKIFKGKINILNPWRVRYEEAAFRKQAKIKNISTHIFKSKQCQERNLFENKLVDELIKGCSSGKDSLDILGRMVMLELWFQYFIDKESCLEKI